MSLVLVLLDAKSVRIVSVRSRPARKSVGPCRRTAERAVIVIRPGRTRLALAGRWPGGGIVAEPHFASIVTGRRNDRPR